MKINLFIFDRTPEPLYENVVEGSALTIHADSDTRLLIYLTNDAEVRSQS